MVEQNGGQIWVESEKGKGTTVKFTVPCENSAMATAAWGQGWIDNYPVESIIEVKTIEPLLVTPSLEQLNALLELARMGNMEEIEAHAKMLRQADEQYVPFADKLYELAKGFEEQEIFALLDKYISLSNK